MDISHILHIFFPSSTEGAIALQHITAATPPDDAPLVWTAWEAHLDLTGATVSVRDASHANVINMLKTAATTATEAKNQTDFLTALLRQRLSIATLTAHTKPEEMLED